MFPVLSQAFLAFCSFVMNIYLMCCFLRSKELHKLENYPLFLLSSIDFFVTGPGYLFFFFSSQFILNGYNPESNIVYAYGMEAYSQFRQHLHYLFGRKILQNVDPFWYSCLPSLFMIRLTEYGFGICQGIVSIFRFVCWSRMLKPPKNDRFKVCLFANLLKA